MKGIAPAILVGIIALVFVGSIAVMYLFPYNPTHPPTANSTNSTPEGIEKVVNSNNEFAIDIFQELSKQNKNDNLFISPYSIYSAMSLLYEGARGKTAEDMRTAMHLPSLTVLEPNFAAIYNEINKKNQYYVLRTGNALWIQKGFKINPDYKRRVEEFFGGKASEVDFVKDPSGSIKTINKFISEQTNGKITNLLSPSSVNQYTRMIITNAIYFKGTWKYKFKKEDTHKQAFYTDDGKSVEIDMMHMYPKEIRFSYGETKNLQILKLPYNGNLSMIIILPKKGNTVNEIIANMSWNDLKSWLDNMKPTKISEIALPKFEFEKKYELNSALTDMGLGELFNSPNLSGIGENLQVQDIIHEAYVKVDEEGTEAAAATAVTVGITAVMPQTQIKFIADHPFVFLIEDDKTGTILFIGAIKNPLS